MPPEDSALVRACLAGDPDAFEGLLDRYRDRIFSFILRMVRNTSDAEDLAQETFLKAFRGLSSYDATRPLLSWLFRIAHNTVIDFKRKTSPGTVSMDDEDVPPLANGTSPEKEVDARLEAELVDRLLAALPSIYREALLLKHKEDLNYPEMARILGVPEGTLKARVSRARDMLKNKLKSVDESAPENNATEAGSPS